jgi:hypothetical protein
MQEKDSGNKSEKKHFGFKLISPRPTFANDMPQEERDIIKQHMAYWTDMADSARNGEDTAHPTLAGGSSPAMQTS